LPHSLACFYWKSLAKTYKTFAKNKKSWSL
jgi:hypothetical protein